MRPTHRDRRARAEQALGHDALATRTFARRALAPRALGRQARAAFRVWGTAAVTAAALLGLELLLALALCTQGRIVLAPGPASLDEVVGAVAAAVALLLGAWLGLSSTAAVLAHAPGRLGTTAGRLADAWAPLLTRRVAAVLVGAAVGSSIAPSTAVADDMGHDPGPGRHGPVAAAAAAGPGFGASSPLTIAADEIGGPGFAASTPAPGLRAVPPDPGFAASAVPAPGPASSLSSAAPTGDLPPAGWTPSRPVQRPSAFPELVTSGALPAGNGEVVVHRGDTLWGLAAAHLGPEATDTEIAEAWPRWYAANRSVIGDDPDRLLPGQVLRVPTAAVAR